jgi:sugar phosphate isomerase/epimerase
VSWTDGPLVLSSYTLGTEVGFAERVRVAAEAGYAGIGLRAENYWQAREAGLDDAAMLEILDRHGVDVREVEYLTDWATDRDADQREKERTVFAMARTFGVRHLNAGLLEHVPVDVVTGAFAELCRRAEELVVALEFMPYSGVPDLPTAWHVVEAAGCANGALLVDAWHWTRSGTTHHDLEPVPAERVVAVQLCDVLEHPMTPLRAESLGHRLPPGQGYGDVAGMVEALVAKKIAPEVVAVEVISEELIARGVDAAARITYDAARAVLGGAR